MTRCLDCGADRTADQCSVCGLTSAAAELVVRRRLVRRTAFFLVGIIVFIAASQVFPALELDAILIFAGMLFLNGKLDTTRPIRVPATVVGKFATGGLPRSRRLLVTSWRGGRRIEHIAVDQNDYDRFQRGDDIVVQAQKGAFGLPWINGV